MRVASATERTEFVPHLKLRTETLLIDRGEGFADDFREVQTAVIELSFDYAGVRVSAAAASRQPFRNARAEAEVRRIIEGFGPVELAGLEDCALIPGVCADYAVHLEGDPNVLCSFSTHAIPRLRAMGWGVQVEQDYPCRVVDGAQWYADLSDPGDERDWFELELGVDVDGERIDLLPVLLEVIESRGFEELMHFRGRTMALPLGEKRFLAVPPHRLRAIGRVLSELYKVEGTSDSGRLRVPEVGSYLDELDVAFGEQLDWVGTTKRSAVRNLSLEHAPASEPRMLKATLRPYQREGLNFLQHLRRHGAGGVLADDMGLGKTLQTIAHIVKEREEGRLDNPVLIVAPTSLVGNWKREIEKFAPGTIVVVHHGSRRQLGVRNIPGADIVITTYGLLVRDTDIFETQPFYLIALDEAQTIKNARSQAHKACKKVNADFRLCLSGTPIENNLDELWALFDFAMPGLLGDAARFRSAFRFPIERDGNADRLETLRNRVRPYILRRLKDEVASELPPKTEMVRGIELKDEQRDLYESIRIAAHAQVRKAVKKKGLAASTIDILSALMKLRQACCDPRLVRVTAAKDIQGSAKFNALFEMMLPMLEQGRRVLIFSQFTSMLALIGTELERQCVSYVSITGNTTNREEKVDIFQAGLAKVFLISLKAGGTGLNLTRADTVIHYDPWWNPAAQAQATDRAYRIGQKRPVFVYNLIVTGSVEERMVNLQRRKKALADGLLAKDEDGQSEFSAGEVDDLFAPLGPSGRGR